MPFGLVGGRLYHVITDPEVYFGDGRAARRGALHLAGRPRHLGRDRARRASAPGSAAGAAASSCRPFADALAPGIVLAQAIGRWGNYFNQELFGKPTDLPWGLEIDPAHRPAGLRPSYATFHPTFLYELLWDLGVAALVIWADRRFRLGHGRVFALYVMAYTAGRGWIETLRIDPARPTTSSGCGSTSGPAVLVFLGAVATSWSAPGCGPGRETPEELEAAPARPTVRRSPPTPHRRRGPR